MPYIKPAEREPYLLHLEEVVSSLPVDEEALGGHLNFCISYIINSLWNEKHRYVRANTIRGAVENALDEWYRVHVVPYEEKKREENGDVW